MSDLVIRPAAECRFDVVSLGEVMLRLDPGEGRIRTARSFRAWEGGGEYNVARGLRRAFGLRGAIVTALADNEIGRLVEDLILTGGLDTSFITWVPYDGIGRGVRNGFNFTERGFGVAGAVGVSDRGQHRGLPDEARGCRLRPPLRRARGPLAAHRRHLRGAQRVRGRHGPEAVTVAKKYGTVVSYDLNYRAVLWKAIGGLGKAQEVNSAIAAVRRCHDRQRGGLHRLRSVRGRGWWTPRWPSSRSTSSPR